MKIIHILKVISTGSFLLASTAGFAQRHGVRGNLGVPETHFNGIHGQQQNNPSGQLPSGPPVINHPQVHFPATPPVNTPRPPINTPRPPATNFNPAPATANRYPNDNRRYTNADYNRHYNNNGRYYYNNAYHPRPYYYRPFRAPSFGMHINMLPSGYYPFRYHRRNYYYWNGIFYRPFGGYYETIVPPLGAVITVLPPGAYFSTIDHIGYYEYEGTYYRPYPGGGYEVTGINGYLRSDLPPETDDGADIISDESIMKPSSQGPEMSSLPSDYKTVVLNNITYYVSPSGEYYTKNIDENGKVTYRLSAATAPQN